MRAAVITGARGVTLTEWPFITMVNLRVDPACDAAGRIEKPTGPPWPPSCGRHSEETPDRPWTSRRTAPHWS